MALKAKHEKLIYDQIQSNFSVGRPINEERQYLTSINENMAFKGGPQDKKYARKVLDVGYKKHIKNGKRNAMRMSSAMSIMLNVRNKFDKSMIGFSDQ